jgi:hypothetical protein
LCIHPKEGIWIAVKEIGIESALAKHFESLLENVQLENIKPEIVSEVHKAL